MTATNYRTVYHRDGSVTYWSVYRQQWVRRTDWVPMSELAAMTRDERNRVIKHLARAI